MSRERERRFDADKALTLLSAGEETIQVVRELSEDGQEVRLHCRSPCRAPKETGIMTRFCTCFEAGLTKLAVTASFAQKDGRTLHVRKAMRPEPDLLQIYDALGLAHRPGGVQKLLS